MRQQQRIDQSVTIESAKIIRLEDSRTNMRIPSASAFQSSTIFLSSSVAISKYMEKICPEPSTKFDIPRDA